MFSLSECKKIYERISKIAYEREEIRVKLQKTLRSGKAKLHQLLFPAEVE